MSVKIEIYGEAAEQVLAELGAFASGLMPRAAGSPPVLAAPYGQSAPTDPASTASDPQSDKPARRSRKAAEPAPAPETPVDDAETEAQDADDEQAEVEATRDDKAPLTTEDVKAAMGGYVKKFGMSATQEDGPKIFVEALGAPPAGEPYWKLSLMADADQAQLAKAVDTWAKATELNPLQRTAV